MEVAFFKAAQFLAAISLLVIVHEFGHFIAARMFGIRIEKFYLFFDAWGKKLFKFNYKGVEYGIGWLPLGGYVKIAGMVDESMDKEAMKQEPKPWEFRSKPRWQRLIVMLGGIIMNIILGILILGLHTYYKPEVTLTQAALQRGVTVGELGKRSGLKDGDIITAIDGDKPTEMKLSRALLLDPELELSIIRKDSTTGQAKNMVVTLPRELARWSMEEPDQFFVYFKHKFQVDSTPPDRGAALAGIKRGDSIVAVGGKPIAYFEDIAPVLASMKSKKTEVLVKRGNDTLRKEVQVDSNGKMGFQPGIEADTIHYALGAAMIKGTEKAFGAISDNLKGLKRLVSNDIPVKKSVKGMIGIADIYSGTWDWSRFWLLTGLISMTLAITNLLPIPALDGGHVLFLLVEMISGRTLPIRFLEIAQTVGMLLLFAFMGFAFYNDIVQLVTK